MWLNATCWLDSSWQAIAVAGLAAVHEFNTRVGTHTALFASESVRACDKQLLVEILDSGSTGLASAAALMNALPVDAVIGPARSASTSIIAIIAGMIDVPQVSYWATSTALDDLTEYPRLMRSIPNDAALATALCEFWSFLGFEYAGLLYLDDIYGEGFESELRRSCSTEGIALQSFSYTSLDAESIDNALALLDKAGIGVVGVLSITATDLRRLTTAAMSRGMLGAGSPTCWWFTGASQMSALEALPEAAQQALHGSYYLNGYGGGTDANPSFTRFVESWPNRDPSDYNDMLPASWKLPADFFATESAASETMRLIGAFEYDAVAAIGLLACQVAPTGPLPRDFGTLVWEAKERLAFDGLTGKVRFDAIGNRNGTDAQMSNLLLESDGVWREALVATVHEGEWQWEGGSLAASGAIFGNNGAALPKDCCADSASGRLRTTLATALTTVAFLVLVIVCVLLWRPGVRAMSVYAWRVRAPPSCRRSRPHPGICSSLTRGSLAKTRWA